MKLTNYMRDAFVRSVMDDVPMEDYDEQIENIVTTAVVNGMPAKLRAVWDDPGLSQCIETAHVWPAKNKIVPVPFYPSHEAALTADVKAECEQLMELKTAQIAAAEKLRSDLRAVAYSVTTRKALVSLLPEFEKYLPEDDRAAMRTVPAVANVVTNLIAAGWPKDKEAAHAS